MSVSGAIAPLTITLVAVTWIPHSSNLMVLRPRIFKTGARFTGMHGFAAALREVGDMGVSGASKLCGQRRAAFQIRMGFDVPLTPVNSAENAGLLRGRRGWSVRVKVGVSQFRPVAQVFIGLQIAARHLTTRGHLYRHALLKWDAFFARAPVRDHRRGDAEGSGKLQ